MTPRHAAQQTPRRLGAKMRSRARKIDHEQDCVDIDLESCHPASQPIVHGLVDGQLRLCAVMPQKRASPY